MHCDSAMVQIDALKKSEDGNQIFLRVHEFAGHRGSLRISSDFQIRSWQACNLLKKPISERYEAESAAPTRPWHSFVAPLTCVPE
ncbi:glycosyl hydrolase-related protein [Alicyclobacillus dauci]|uniref:Glycosyl hydrolase-related protein n=1 Tax=Alicyclobacillus dauci TaxID=1475485 RepID=A0ABY6Z1F6_9BACL|nr:glycosyl hydrolase-related protein [Alicyclobacillus dauci]WAH36728.1 glycosyl hydrolase-related protein [Alicyclobacillus dauci]